MLTDSRASVECRPLSAPPLVGDPATDDRYAEGRQVVVWIEQFCRFGEGDRFGQPVVLEPFQIGILLRLFEHRPDGRRRYRRGFLEMPKGAGKTPLSSWIAAYELTHRESAVIPVAAASYEQADLLFGDLRTCVKESEPLGEMLEAFEHEILVRNGPGRAFRVAAVAGTNDGLRPTLFLADEVHEWVGSKERVHLVIGNGCSKRADSLQLSTTTPGWDLETLAGRMHQHGVMVNNDEIDDPELCFIWFGCAEDRFNLDDPTELRMAIRAANPAADRFVNVEDVAARYHQQPRHEFIRYHLGQWTTVSEGWLPVGAWAACEDRSRSIPDRAQVVLAFDGSNTVDATALVAILVDKVPHVELINLWEPPPNAPPDWQVPRHQVLNAIRDACTKWRVEEIAVDAYLWQSEMLDLQAEKLPIVQIRQQAGVMVPAQRNAFEMITGGRLTHSGDQRLTRHVGNCQLRDTPTGGQLSKVSKHSTKRIDAAVAMTMGLARLDKLPPPRKRPRIINLAAVGTGQGGGAMPAPAPSPQNAATLDRLQQQWNSGGRW
jgi:phage terminase large subunit-like protein